MHNVIYFNLLIFILALTVSCGNDSEAQKIGSVEPLESETIDMQMRILYSALKTYYVDFRCYPQSIDQLSTPIAYNIRGDLQKISPDWDYSSDASGQGFNLRHQKNKDYELILPHESMETIRKLRNEGKAEDLLELAEQEPNALLRAEILGIFYVDFIKFNQSNQEKIILANKGFAKDPNSRVRMRALSILGKSGKPELAPLVVEALQDESAIVKEAAFRSLGQLRDPSTLPQLKEQLRHSDPHVRYLAVSAIANFSGPEPLKVLLETIGDTDPKVRSQAIKSCANRQDPQILKILIRALQDPDENVRREAILGLAKSPGEQTVSVLVEHYYRENLAALKVETIHTLHKIQAVKEAARLTDDMSVETKLMLTKENMSPLRERIECWYCDFSMYPVPAEVFDHESVYCQRYAANPQNRINPEVVKLLEQLSKSKRRSYVLSEMKNTSEFSESELGVISQIEKIANLNEKYSWISYRDLEINRLYPEGFFIYPHHPHPKMESKDVFNSDSPGLYRYGTIVQNDKRFHQHTWVLLSNGPDGDIDIKPELLDVANGNRLVCYNTYPFKGKPQSFWNLVYDPTNGLVSNGDIVTLPLYHKFK